MVQNSSGHDPEPGETPDSESINTGSTVLNLLLFTAGFFTIFRSPRTAPIVILIVGIGVIINRRLSDTNNE